MSTLPLRCPSCHGACVYERCSPFGEDEAAYGVSWRCPEGHGSALDICPIGPLVPSEGLCLNCGAPVLSDEADSRCGACGLLRRECPAALGLTDQGDADPISSARAAFEEGLFRRGIAILNQALQKNVQLLEAWDLKARFFSSLRFNRVAAEMLDGPLGKLPAPADRIWLLEEQSYLWAECERGEEAFRSADAAKNLGSNSVRSHYLRGRALGLLGRLEEARDEMTQVLTLDPNNPDAKRGLTMIDAAIAREPRKRWWEFWKK